MGLPLEAAPDVFLPSQVHGFCSARGQELAHDVDCKMFPALVKRRSSSNLQNVFEAEEESGFLMNLSRYPPPPLAAQQLRRRCRFTPVWGTTS